MEFNKEQLEVLSIVNGKHVVQAPAGCGKTQILTERISTVLEQGIDAKEIVCLTFTNKAAAEMKERLAAPDNFAGFIGNFHSFCAQFLKQNGVIGTATILLGEDDFSEIIEGIIKKNKAGFNMDRWKLAHFLNDYKRVQNNLEPLFDEDYKTVMSHMSSPAYIEAYETYEAVKLRYNLVDFDDLLTLTIQALNEKPNLTFNSFKWIQVDEAQDLNLAQWEIVNHISAKSECAVFYGDYEQSIYSFLGSDDGKFEKLFNDPSFVNHSLDQNYRSNNAIITVLNEFLSSAMESKSSFGKKEKSVIAESEDCRKIIEIDGLPSDEMEYLASSVIKPISESEGNVAILLRSNKAVDLYSDELLKIGVDHFKMSGNDIFKSQEMKVMFSILNTLLNQMDLLSWGTVLSFFIKDFTVSKSRELMHKSRLSGFLPSDFLDRNLDSYLNKFLASYSNNRVVVFDTETTSLDTDDGEIIQIGAIEMINGVVGREFEVYIKPDVPVSEEIVRLTKITNEILNERGVSALEGLEQFMAFLGDNCTVIAHNLDYDISILKSFCGRKSTINVDQYIGKSFDSLLLAQLLYPKMKRYKLEYLLKKLNLEGENSHNAMDDVKATISLIKNIVDNSNSIVLKTDTFRAEYGEKVKEFFENYSQKIELYSSTYYENTSISNILEGLSNELFLPEFYDHPRFLGFLKYVREHEKPLAGKSLRMRLDLELSHLRGVKESDLVDDAVKVVVSTVHKSKGLAFDTVIIPEAVQGTYPNYFSEKITDPIKKKKAIGEDMRLFYVAMSRSKSKLIISYHTTFISNYGSSFDKNLTSFVESIKGLFTVTKVKPK